LMPRVARIVIPGCPHHVTQRGNHRHKIFFSDRERAFYLKLQRKYFSRHRVRSTGYALMTNHVHHVVIPELPTSLAMGLGRIHGDFSHWQQIRRDLTGHLWQNRFFSCPLDEEHFWAALRYVELNPVRAGLVRYAWEWQWSSARAHVTGIDETGLLDMDPWRSRFDPDTWKAFLEQGVHSHDEVHQLRHATRTGRPLGSDEFIGKLEVLTGRRLRPGKRGPKPRSSRSGRN